MSVSRHENLNKKRKKWRYAYRKFRITPRFNIEDTKAKERNQIRVMEVKKGSHILFLESRAQIYVFTDLY